MTKSKQPLSRRKSRKSTASGAAAMVSRRNVLRGAAVGGAVVATQIGAPFIGTAKAQTTTWKMQSSWSAGVLGYAIFE